MRLQVMGKHIITIVLVNVEMRIIQTTIFQFEDIFNLFSISEISENFDISP